MPGLSLFNQVADVGREFLALSSSNSMLRKYTWHLGAICDLLKHTHSMVVQKLQAVEATSCIEDAKSLISELSDDPLTQSFRANGLCDMFEGFGKSLRPLAAAVTDPAASVETLPISEERRVCWSNFCDVLESRERRVAETYVNEIRQLVDLGAHVETNLDLSAIKVAARKASDTLTSQIADFDALATRFRH
jgi:hypothetical protein